VGARGVAPDLAFNLFDAPAPDHPLPASPRLLLSFRADQRPEQAAEAEALALATARVVGAGAITCFAQVRLDEDPTTRLAASLESEGATTHVVVSRSIAASEAALAGADLVLTNRLHVALLALALGRPTIVARGVERQTKRARGRGAPRSAALDPRHRPSGHHPPGPRRHAAARWAAGARRAPRHDRGAGRRRTVRLSEPERG
jgi:hypothetical protein